MADLRFPEYIKKEREDAEEKRLLQQACQGNVEAFGSLYERLSPAIFRFLVAHVSNYHDAEDLTAEVFMRAWKSLPRYHQQNVPFLAYLLRIARNILIDHYRRTGNARQAEPLDYESEIPESLAGPPENLQNVQEIQELYQVLGQLREEYRTVLILRFLEDYDVEKAASLMGRSSGALRVLTHRALAALRGLLDNKIGAQDE